MEFFDPGRDMGSTRGDENDSAEVEGDEEDNGGCAVVAAADDADGCGGGEAGQSLGAGLAGAYSLGDFAAEPSYQVSFSQHYRQLLLACL